MTLTSRAREAGHQAEVHHLAAIFVLREAASHGRIVLLCNSFLSLYELFAPGTVYLVNIAKHSRLPQTHFHVALVGLGFCRHREANSTDIRL